MSRNRIANRQYPQKTPKRQKNKKEIMIEMQEQSQHLVSVEPDYRKKFTKHDIKPVKALTDNQLYAFQEWAQDQNLVLEGYAGVGKSFLALYMALNTVLDPNTEQDKIIIVRSAVPTRDVGFLPGELEEKTAVYELPFKQICDQLFTWKNSYDNLKKVGIIEFTTTSFLRGCTWDNAVVIIEEMQSNTSHELETTISRLGQNSRLIMCGDDLQNDIGSKSGLGSILSVLRRMTSVSFIDFGLKDIVRSGFVKEFLMAKYS